MYGTVKQQINDIIGAGYEPDSQITTFLLQSKLWEIITVLATEIDELKRQLDLQERRCSRHRNTSDDWMDGV